MPLVARATESLEFGPAADYYLAAYWRFSAGGRIPMTHVSTRLSLALVFVSGFALPGVAYSAADDVDGATSSASDTTDSDVRLTGSLQADTAPGVSVAPVPAAFVFEPTLPNGRRVFTNHFLSSGLTLGAGDTPEDGGTDTGLFSLRGGVGLEWGQDRISVPLFHQEYRYDRDRSATYDAMGLEWSRRFDSRQFLSLSAQYGDYAHPDQSTHDTVNTVAAVGWTGEFSGSSRPRLSSSLYVGDEAAKDDVYHFLGRRYYGVTLDGRFDLFRNHTPYASLRLQRSDYNGEDPAYSVARREDYSRLAAGWDWQVRPNWGLRAEANYSLNNSNLDFFNYDHTEFRFTTRFDFH
jgi:hypothetical protein